MLSTCDTEEKSSSINVTVKIDILDRDRLKSLATTKKRTPHYLMKEAIIRYIEDEEIEQRNIQEATLSYEHYKQTGLHLTLDEVRRWREQLQIDHNTKTPVCHV